MCEFHKKQPHFLKIKKKLIIFAFNPRTIAVVNFFFLNFENKRVSVNCKMQTRFYCGLTFIFTLQRATNLIKFQKTSLFYNYLIKS